MNSNPRPYTPAENSGIAVVVTNQVVAEVDGYGGVFNPDPKKPTGGVLSF